MTRGTIDNSILNENPDLIRGGNAIENAGVCLSVLVIANDISAMNVALPSIERDFNTNISTVQLVINAYALYTAMSLVTGGRLADIYGRRRVFFIGLEYSHRCHS